MTAPDHIGEFREALLFLATAGVVVPLFRRLHVSPVVGFIAAGVLLGPFGVGGLATRAPWLAAFRLETSDAVATLSEWGVVFLLFMIGLELTFERLRRMRRLVFGLGALQVAASTLVLAGLLFAGGLGSSAALVGGAALSLSSTAIVVPSLTERRRLGTPAGRAAFAVLLFQDLMIAPLLFMVTVLGRGEGSLWEGFLGAVLPAVAALLLIVGFGRLVLRPVFHVVAKAGSTEFFVAACLLVVVAAGAASAAAGLSMALGAFIAGLLLAETEYRREVEVTIEPFKGLLLGLFFMSIGAGLDLGLLARSPLLILGLAVGLVLIKTALLAGAARLFGVPRAAALEVGALLGPGGEFAFVLLGVAVAQGVAPASVGAILSVAVTLSMLVIPLVAAFFARRAARARAVVDPALAALVPPPAPGRVIVVGYGRVGRLVGAMLARHDKPFIAIDGSADLVREARETSSDVFWGDATRIDLLRRCGVGAASAVVVTVDASGAAERIVKAVRRERADITIVARARDADHARRLYDLGATDAIPETVEASLQLSEAVLVDIGVPMGFVIASIHEKRDEFRKLLQRHDGESRAIRVSTRLKNSQRRREARS